MYLTTTFTQVSLMYFGAFNVTKTGQQCDHLPSCIAFSRCSACFKLRSVSREFILSDYWVEATTQQLLADE